MLIINKILSSLGVDANIVIVIDFFSWCEWGFNNENKYHAKIQYKTTF